MFKRVNKRIKRKEEEEKLGIDEEMKEVMGLQDTDSSESDTADSDSDSDKENDEEERGSSDEDNLREQASDDALDLEDGVDEESEDTEDGVTVSTALQNPIRYESASSDIALCALCPGKVFKNASMVKIHESSKVCSTFVLSIK
jgi:hypothetical protein